jgi:LDH2 family malate/lactate/ureidoglycolate dehydrogenase
MTGVNVELVYALPSDAEEFARALLVAHGVPGADAAVVAHCLVLADLRGVSTHGVVRLPGYLDRIRRGLVNPRPELVPDVVAPAAASLDGQNGLGFVVATRAMEQAVELARTAGVGVVSARHSTHFGMAAAYVLQAIEAGMIGMIMTNASRAMPAWGSRTSLLGTSPVAVAAPGGSLGPFVLDMSPAVAARGKIRMALRRGETIPLGYALDAEGRATTDPAAALQGVVLPIGGPKGSGLAMMMDIFGGVISGAAFAGGVGDQYKDYDRPQDVGHFFLALKPDLFLSRADYERRMDELVRAIRESEPAEGFTEVLVPGEVEARSAERRSSEGIPYSRDEVSSLQAEAAQASVPELIVTNEPSAS